jgi:hypothetical protein
MALPRGFQPPTCGSEARRSIAELRERGCRRGDSNASCRGPRPRASCHWATPAWCWCSTGDSNAGPPGSPPGALPSELVEHPVVRLGFQRTAFHGRGGQIRTGGSRRPPGFGPGAISHSATPLWCRPRLSRPGPRGLRPRALPSELGRHPVLLWSPLPDFNRGPPR